MESNERLRELHKSVEKPKDLQRRSQNKTRSARSNSVQPPRASRGGTFPHQGELGHRDETKSQENLGVDCSSFSLNYFFLNGKFPVLFV